MPNATLRPVDSGPRRSTHHQKEQTTMRFMIVMKANKDSEAGVLPDHDILTRMGSFNEELVNAGIMLAGEGLQSSAKGARVTLIDGNALVNDAASTETKELIAGFWMWQCKSK